MSKEEILTKQQFLTIADLQKIFDCGLSSAQKIMREIKTKSDSLKIKGKVTVKDYEIWFNGKKEIVCR